MKPTPILPALVLAVLMVQHTGWDPVRASDEKTLGAYLGPVEVMIRESRYPAALDLSNDAIEAYPENPAPYLARAEVYDAMDRHEDAIGDLDRALELDPTHVRAWSRRGGQHFKLGLVEKSIADFDKANELDPKREPHDWQRGISYYYAERHVLGARQFDAHQTVNPNDVENAVWRLLCMARQPEVGIEKAREQILPISGDTRVPMKEIHTLFSGKGSVEDVFRAAKQGQVAVPILRQRLFYAHLYVGLYYEAIGNPTLARDHITRADKDYPVSHYMGDVARVHLMLRETQQEPESTTPETTQESPENKNPQ